MEFVKIFRNIENFCSFGLKRTIFLVFFIEFFDVEIVRGCCSCSECCSCGERWHEELEVCENLQSDFQIHFLYVGEGDCIVIKYKDFLFIVDAGEGLSAVKKKTDVVQYITSLMKRTSVVRVEDDAVLLKEKNKKIKINGVILTHPHPDHYWNMNEVFDNFNINKFFYYKMREDYGEMNWVDKFNYLQYEERVVAPIDNFKGEKQKLDFSRGPVSLFGDSTLKIEAIGPTKDHIDFNDNSIVLLITYKNFRFLLMGDAGIAAEKELIEFCEGKGINIKEVDLIKIGHHGHSSSSCVEFVEYVKPKNVVNSTGPHVFSCGLCNWHERPSVMRRWRDCRKGKKQNGGEVVNVYTTEEQGNIVAYIDEGDGLKFCRN